MVEDGIPIRQLRLDRFAAARAVISPTGQERAWSSRAWWSARTAASAPGDRTLVSERDGLVGGTAVVGRGWHAITRRGLRRGEAVRVTLRSVSADGRRSRPVTGDTAR